MAPTLAAVPLLAGCATRYQEMGLTGGVAAEQMSANVFRIKSRGNAYTEATTVQDYVLLKAAETTKSVGGTHSGRRHPAADPSTRRRLACLNSGPITPRVAFLAALFLLATVLIFFVYRFTFLHLSVPFSVSDGTWKIYLSGARLDIALVAIELMVLLQIFSILRFFRLRAFAISLFLITTVHIWLATINLIFFKERYQHLWEMLIANISRPSEIIVAIHPFLEAHPVEMIIAILLIVALSFVVFRLCLRIPPMTLDLWKPILHVRRSFLIVVVLVLVNLDPVAHGWRLGWIPLPTASQFYMQYESYEANQAVINPVHDLIRFFVPAVVASIGAPKAAHLEPGEALLISRSLLRVGATYQRYPLLQNLPAGPQLGLRNVIFIMAEGLTQSILHRTEEDREITPFLNDLARRGLYFTKTGKILPSSQLPFTALVITATTHSPWVIANHIPKVFAKSRLNAFRYLDTSIENFVSSLKKKLNGLEDTMIVITGDHTSVTFGGGQMERLRVPLIFYSPRLEPLAAQLNPHPNTPGSHVDIVPTILQLLDGAHSYSGMGVSLISPNRSNARVISSNRFSSLYLQGQFVLQFSPASAGADETQVFPIKDGEIVNSDVSAAPVKRLQREFFALYETSARLTKEKRILPIKPDSRPEQAGNW